VRTLAALLCLTFAVLLFSAGEAWSLPKCPSGKTYTSWTDCVGTQQLFYGKYDGEWRGGNKHGQGTFTFADGDKYTGEFKDNKRHGQGTYTWPGGTKYVGEWRDGSIHGQGTKTWPDGTKYVGEYRDGKKHGQGTNTFADGDKYVGEWKDDKRHGQGTYTDPDGNVMFEGVWVDDEYLGTKEESEKRLKNRKRAAEKLELRVKRHKAALEGALVRCLYEDLDRIVSDAAEQIVTRKCNLELKDLSTKELEESYD